MTFAGFCFLWALQTLVRAFQVPRWLYCKVKRKPFEWFAFGVQ